MTGYTQLVQMAHAAATAAMTEAVTTYRNAIKARGQEAWDKAAKACGGEHAIEPMYCGFAWVIVRRKENPEFVKAMKAQGGDSRDLGSVTGWANKGQRTTATDWQFHGPGEYRGQSMDIKEVGAIAFAKVLTDAGIKDVSVYTRAD